MEKKFKPKDQKKPLSNLGPKPAKNKKPTVNPKTIRDTRTKK